MATDSQDTNPAMAPGLSGQAAGGLTGDPGVSVSSGSASVDRLLKLQEAEGTPTQNGERSPPRKTLLEGSLPAKVAAAEAAASAANPLATLQAAILGQTTNAGTPQGAAPGVSDTSGPREFERSNMGVAVRPSETQARSGSQERPSTGIAFTVARYVRENRVLVIGVSLAVLAMVWAAATFASQQRRR